jgi:hypothetical protein
MKKDPELKITIIGLGNLMEEVFPCISETVGKQNLPTQVNATTADEADLKGKRERFGIEVILSDNLAALKAMEPDLIFFAPPPSVAPKLIETELRAYFDYVRENKLTLPDIFAFPPVPAGKVYYQHLGEDINVMRIIPSALKSIGGVTMSTPALATAEKPWPKELHERTHRIWAVQNGLSELPSEMLLSVLAAGIMSTVTPEMTLDMADILKRQNSPINYQDLASYMRARHQQVRNFSREESLSCSLDAVTGPLCQVLDAIVGAWFAGILDFASQAKLPDRLAEVMVTNTLDTMLWFAQAEPPEAIKRHSEVSATKGGVLEKGLMVYQEVISPFIEKKLASLTAPVDDHWRNQLSELVSQGAKTVLEHGKMLDN